jgi:hypothetical protein
LIKAGDTIITDVADLKSAVAKARVDGTIPLQCEFATLQYYPLHTAEGSLMLTMTSKMS